MRAQYIAAHWALPECRRRFVHSYGNGIFIAAYDIFHVKPRRREVPHPNTQFLFEKCLWISYFNSALPRKKVKEWSKLLWPFDSPPAQTSATPPPCPVILSLSVSPPPLLTSEDELYSLFSMLLVEVYERERGNDCFDCLTCFMSKAMELKIPQIFFLAFCFPHL